MPTILVLCFLEIMHASSCRRIVFSEHCLRLYSSYQTLFMVCDGEFGPNIGSVPASTYKLRLSVEYLNVKNLTICNNNLLCLNDFTFFDY